jgi:SAM-dependent methyltransferase
LGTSKDLLDVGCGAGEKSKYLCEKGLRVTGVDFSEEMIKLAKVHVPKADFFVKDILQPLEFDKSFDGVFAQAVLLHIPKVDIAEVLENILLPLKPGGYFYASVKGRRPDGKEEDISKDAKYGYEFERFFSYFTLPELVNLVETAGLSTVETSSRTVGKKEWLQIIARR